ncbi:methyltransferase [Acrocarpospora phusangensis]|uniref:Methyltransferase n=1 Tax=Acrocarpospora phusangensis TaxID=1070424 RepID=A0A919UNJ1_9ACTN|nr:class I SAM-dependent methyltransferase [Acrocarpospora phusangensis]GIH22730.1 methyltransferase [Acrocarpospora phusangensis]
MTVYQANPVRGRLNSLTFRLLDRYAHHLLGDRKQALFADLPETIAELGPGTGANFRYYRPGTRVIAIEPNPHMRSALTAHAAARGIAVDLRARPAEDTGLPSASVDVVVCTLVLCTVPDPLAAVRETLRVLRPGGRLIFVEHVAGEGGYARLQRGLARPWRWFFEGCEVRRDTEHILRDAGFTEIKLERYTLKSVFGPINPQIAGVAIR